MPFCLLLSCTSLFNAFLSGVIMPFFASPYVMPFCLVLYARPYSMPFCLVLYRKSVDHAFLSVVTMHVLIQCLSVWCYHARPYSMPFCLVLYRKSSRPCLSVCCYHARPYLMPFCLVLYRKSICHAFLSGVTVHVLIQCLSVWCYIASP